MINRPHPTARRPSAAWPLLLALLLLAAGAELASACSMGRAGVELSCAGRSGRYVALTEHPEDAAQTQALLELIRERCAEPWPAGSALERALLDWGRLGIQRYGADLELTAAPDEAARRAILAEADPGDLMACQYRSATVAGGWVLTEPATRWHCVTETPSGAMCPEDRVSYTLLAAHLLAARPLVGAPIALAALAAALLLWRLGRPRPGRAARPTDIGVLTLVLTPALVMGGLGLRDLGLALLIATLLARVALNRRR